MVGIVTNRTGVFDYALVDYLDTRPGVPFDGMIYQNAEVTNCSVPKISLGFTSGVFSDQVILDVAGRMQWTNDYCRYQ